MNKGLELLEKNKIFVDSLNMEVVPLSIAKKALEMTKNEFDLTTIEDRLNQEFENLTKSINKLNFELKEEI